ncbi:restriction endonuclease subunit S [Vibrio parahaemolyticus]|nr:restriction endonuclease subunit S [Vibrio parahaemolyticus]EJG1606205.1 restriction endonuclease subunit S [Vibrio parahaemolyticus]
MSFEIKKATLGDFLNFKNGKKSPERADNASFPVFGSNGLIGRAESTNCPENTIVIGRVGSYCGSVHFSKEKCWVSDNAISCSSKNAGEEHFWFYVLTKLNLNQFSSGSGQPLLNQATLNAVECEVPNNSPLRALIGSVLNDYDKKIKLNAATNQTLEQMAQAIFKSWFVDFDPVKAKMNGEQPEGMDAATASLFPEKLVESELGLIPEGWDAGTVGSVTAAKGGYAFKSKQFVDEGNPVIKIKNITSAGTVTTSDCQCVDDDIAKTASRFKLSDGDLLMAMTGATVGKSGIYVSDGRDGYLNQRVARFESKVDSTQPCWFTYNLVNKDSIFEQIVGAAQGSAQPNISSKGIEQVKTVIPTFDLISKYQELVAPLYAKWISNFRENSQLSELRDTLLPKLLSGEIELVEQS